MTKRIESHESEQQKPKPHGFDSVGSAVLLEHAHRNLTAFVIRMRRSAAEHSAAPWDIARAAVAAGYALAFPSHKAWIALESDPLAERLPWISAHARTSAEQAVKDAGLPELPPGPRANPPDALVGAVAQALKLSYSATHSVLEAEPEPRRRFPDERDFPQSETP